MNPCIAIAIALYYDAFYIVTNAVHISQILIAWFYWACMPHDCIQYIATCAVDSVQY